MTREEKQKAIDALKISAPIMVMTQEEFKDYIQTLNKIMDWLEQESRWIPVSERLPEESITVIGTTEFDDIYKTELYDDCGEKKWYADGNFDVPIVAWIPLPEGFKEDK